jgi:hypothetical protein
MTDGDTSGDNANAPEPTGPILTDVNLTVIVPGPGARFVAGHTVTFRVFLDGFSLASPDSTDDGGRGPAHDDEDHSGAAVDPDRQGLLFVYLNAEDDNDAHSTVTDTEFYYTLPGSLSPGEHEFRLSLRTSDGLSLGIEQRVGIVVAEP